MRGVVSTPGKNVLTRDLGGLSTQELFQTLQGIVNDSPKTLKRIPDLDLNTSLNRGSRARALRVYEDGHEKSCPSHIRRGGGTHPFWHVSSLSYRVGGDDKHPFAESIRPETGHDKCKKVTPWHISRLLFAASWGKEQRKKLAFTFIRCDLILKAHSHCALFSDCDCDLVLLMMGYRSWWCCGSRIVWTLPLSPVQPICWDKTNRSCNQKKNRTVRMSPCTLFTLHDSEKLVCVNRFNRWIQMERRTLWLSQADKFMPIILCAYLLITARIRRIGEGTVFTGVCLSTGVREEVSPPPGIGRQMEYLIRRGRYGSCVYAGGLSCFFFCA